METIIIPIVIGIVEALKRSFPKLDPYLPLLAIVLGIGLVVPANLEEVLQGIIYGLSASGLYSGTKHTVSYITK